MRAATDIHVSPGGTGAKPGTAGAPVATLAQAQSLARTASAKGEAVKVTVHGGVYYLPETLVFDARDSGTAKASVLYQAVPGEKVVISGGRKLNLKWDVYKDHIYKASVPEGLRTEELFINGERQVLARYPNFDPKAKYFDGFAPDAASRERAARWADPVGGYLHAMHPALWGDFTWRITGKNAQGDVTLEGGWQNNRGGSVHKEIRFVENIFEELDAPGEWYLDSKTHTIYCWPPASVDLARATVEVTCLPHLVEFRGTERKPVRCVTLRGFTFRNAARTMMDTREPLLRTDWAICRGGAIYFEGTEDCALEDAFLDQLGGNAVFVNNYNRRVTVRGCEIARAGASGICFVGDPAAARNALSHYNQSNNAASIDHTPGPANNNYPAQCRVEDCLIYLTGRVEKQTAGVEIDLAQDITVRHCSIYDMPRAGINIGDGCWGGHLIEYCDIFDTVKETGDHGSFNSWGRDRYWNLNGTPPMPLPELALLDVVKPITLRKNRWRCDHGWDVDLDDGSSNYEICDNLFLHGGLKLREGFHRRVWNNIAVNNTLHPHVWYDDSRDEVTRNIWMGSYRPAGGMPKGKWGKEVDRNLFTTSEADRTRFAGNGCDTNSLVGDPMFMEPAKGDYRVREASPALRLGFMNFPMDQFGVVSPTLKAKARTPEIPVLERRAATPEKPAAPGMVWLGATVKDLEGEEYSAFGVAKGERGVALLDVPVGSAAAAAGLRKGDLLQALNGKRISGPEDMFAVLGRVGDTPVVADIVRDQRPQKVDLGSAPRRIREIPAGSTGIEVTPIPLILWYEKPAQRWVEALPVGNGRIGGMVFGGVAKERIQFNEDSFWTGNDGRPGVKSEFGAYQAFGDLFLSIDEKQPAGEPPSGTPATPSDYRRTLDLSTGIATTSFTVDRVPFLRETFASRADEVLVTCWSSTKTGSISGKVELKGTHGETTTAEGTTLSFGGKLPNGERYAASARVIVRGGKANAADSVIRIIGADEVLILAAAGTDYSFDSSRGNKTGADPMPKVLAQLGAAAGKSYAKLKGAHLRSFQPLMGRILLNLGKSTEAQTSLPINLRKVKAVETFDPELEVLLFQYGRYLLLGSSRPGSLPANLQGLWNDSNNPAWSCDYHANINVQMNYWPSETANMPEAHEALFAWMKSLLPIWREHTAEEKEFQLPSGGPRGWAVRTMLNPWGGEAFKWDKTANAWLCQHLWEHYAFGGDKIYLEETAYPVMKETVEFWEDHLKVLPDGRLVVPHGWSPEHGPDEDGVSYNQQIVWDLFSNYIEAADALGTDKAYRDRIAGMREKLVAPKIGKWGQLQEWMVDKDDQNDHHRHTSHLFGVYPGRQISMTKTPELAKAAKISLDARGTAGNSDVREWSFAWRSALYARLRDGEQSHLMIRNLLSDRNTCPNLFGLHPPLQLDGNFGITAGMVEMLLQSQEGEINLLPALPTSWNVGQVSGLRGRGNCLIDLSWRGGQLESAKIRTPKGGRYIVRYGEKTAGVNVPAGSEVTLDGALSPISRPTMSPTNHPDSQL